MIEQKRKFQLLRRVYTRRDPVNVADACLEETPQRIEELIVHSVAFEQLYSELICPLGKATRNKQSLVIIVQTCDAAGIPCAGKLRVGNQVWRLPYVVCLGDVSLIPKVTII